MAAPKRSLCGTQLLDKFLDLPRHILEFATTEQHNKREISVVGRSGCRLTKAVKNSGYFPAWNAVVML